VETSGLKDETFPAWSRLKVEFAARGDRGPVTLHWYDGGKKPAADLVVGRKLAANGAFVVGTKGTLYSVEWTGGEWVLLPAERFRDYQAPAPSLPRAPGGSQHQEWLQACRGGPAAFCRFDGFAAALTETMLVATLALRLGRKIVWDAENLVARGCPEAAPLIRRPYRSGW
jgi:hypothetical protein